MYWVKWASFLMFVGVGLGAFGAHGLRPRLTDHYFDVYRTAVLYHLIHALGLFAIAWLSTQSTDARIKMAGILFVTGTALFSGSLYILSVTQIKWLGAMTPLGGLSFMAGWFLLFISRL